MIKSNVLTALINNEKLSITSPLNNKQGTITTAKSDQNKRIKLMPYTPLLSQSFLDSFNS